MSAPTWSPIPRQDIPVFDTVMAYVDHWAASAPSRVAVTDFGGDSITYGALPSAVRRIRGTLRQHGVRPGDVVATLAPPSLDHWLTFLATVDMGAIWLGLNPRYRLDEWRSVLQVAAPRVLFARDQIGERDYRADIDSLTGEFGVERVPLGSGTDADDRPDSPDPREPGLLVFTSGSTGQPKGVLLAQAGLVACARIQAHHYGQWGGVVLNPLPINHVGCIVDIGLTSLVVGATQVFLEEFSPGTYIRAIEEANATLLGGVPAMLLYLMTDPGFWNADLSSVQRILWSGGAMPRTGAEVLASLGKPLHNFYGMTETTGSVTYTPPDAGVDQVVGTVGIPDPDWQVRIADPESGTELAVGTVGEIQVRGPGVLHSYLGDPQATADAFTVDGYLKTADLGVSNADGSISLAGRLRQVFKTGGYNVFPRQVEEAIEALPGVIMASVVARKHDVLGEVGIAFVTPIPGAPFDEEALRTALKGSLASYKIPKRFIQLDEPPLLAAGKVDRATLESLAAEIPL